MIKRPFDDYIQYEPMSGCWLWSGFININGYGEYYIKSKARLAHRMSWEISVGPIPQKMFIDHKCRNRACVNPQHLRVVTPRQNTTENSNSWSGRAKARTHCSGCGKSFAEVRMTDYFVKRGTRKCADCACARARAWYKARKTNNPPVITESRNG